ncbi:MAG: GTP 3',8-cyclase MoaA [Candidatus Heimdallarchaeota archaeon]|nr:GTP 3',8-cyclase MoaA [Candidatus Heimdallarchaeota archaeon]
MKYAPLVDLHGRKINSMRISVTDRCNFRCVYCMPDGVEWTDHENILSYEEILRIIDIVVNSGVSKIRLTGGEPTIRKDFVSFCRMLKQEFPNIDLAITTNGHSLVKLARDLRDAGVDRLNISLDILEKDKFEVVTQRKHFDSVLEGIDLALELGFKIKINAVSMKNFNDDPISLQQFVEYSRIRDLPIRFIELMPFTGNAWSSNRFISSAELRENIGKISPLSKLEMEEQSQTSRDYQTQDGAKFGFISSVSESFCQYCDRIRLTADGNIRPCLHDDKEYPLRDKMRTGATDEELLEIIRAGLSKKWKEHPDFLEMNYKPPLSDRSMVLIGG